MKRARLAAAKTARSPVATGATLAAKERLRRLYRPGRVSTLFVGEAPPASGRFFYCANSGLYCAIRDTFLAAFPELRSVNFLAAFQAMGCYLVDLCGQPVDRMKTPARRRVCLAGEARLSQTIRTLSPNTVVTVARSIGGNVKRAEERAGWSGLHLELPYPGRWYHYRREFRRKLTPVLRAHLITTKVSRSS